MTASTYRIAQLNERLATMPKPRPRSRTRPPQRRPSQAVTDKQAARAAVAVTLDTPATCRSCQATKPQGEFPKTKIDWATRRSSWIQRYASTCTECSP